MSGFSLVPAVPRANDGVSWGSTYARPIIDGICGDLEESFNKIRLKNSAHSSSPPLALGYPSHEKPGYEGLAEPNTPPTREGDSFARSTSRLIESKSISVLISSPSRAEELVPQLLALVDLARTFEGKGLDMIDGSGCLLRKKFGIWEGALRRQRAATVL